MVTILIAGVAAGLGGSLTVRNAKSSCPKFEPTPTDNPITTTPTGVMSSILSLSPTSDIFWQAAAKTGVSIPSTADFRYSAIGGAYFNAFYNKDSPNSDAMGLLAETFEMYLEACANLEYYIPNSTCQGAAWVARWRMVV
ncbi:hypothetical protein EJ05DRAFT_266170 [Pseudovirgaria hyperparasitica]|uniref:Uncharacterized protein n=1 Tax=Pseudovirgaria hyperparasitica TaxID=470096 RepID=A0A6A6VQ39_9PEZI|nr:uncharacterized protein EJ05DRAFT_266170 [Pseudovirgaria hyperparasitica]KAF2752758.1 hypothetical protein EJ05DRAFT_266170 [Pseudovirgaria hyperparasitica]